MYTLYAIRAMYLSPPGDIIRFLRRESGKVVSRGDIRFIIRRGRGTSIDGIYVDGQVVGWMNKDEARIVGIRA